MLAWPISSSLWLLIWILAIKDCSHLPLLPIRSSGPSLAIETFSFALNSWSSLVEWERWEVRHSSRLLSHLKAFCRERVTRRVFLFDLCAARPPAGSCRPRLRLSIRTWCWERYPLARFSFVEGGSHRSAWWLSAVYQDPRQVFSPVSFRRLWHCLNYSND